MKSIRQAGLSLTELMIALALSLILVAAVTSVFLSSRQTSTIGNAFSGIQENARFATQVIGYDLLNAGHMGCNANSQAAHATVGADSDNLAYVGAVSGWSSTDTKPSWLSGTQIKPGTDVLKIQYAATNAFRLTADMAGSASTIVFGGGSGSLGTGPNVIADCARSELFSFSATPTLSGTTLTGTPFAALAKAYAGAVTEVMGFISRTYYVGTDSVLHRYTNAGVAVEEIADNVEDFRVLYGIDSNGDGAIDKYVATPAGTIRSVQLCFLFTNADAKTIASATSTYKDCHGTTKTNTSQAFHQIYRTTIALRNGLT